MARDAGRARAAGREVGEVVPGRRDLRSEQGAVAAEHVGVLVVVSAIIAALLAIGLADRVEAVGQAAVDCLFTTDECELPAADDADGSDGGGETPDDGGETPDDGGQTPDDGGQTPEGGPPAITDVAADPTVIAAIEVVWEDSNPDAPEVPAGQPGSQKQEHGGWIIWDADSGAYRVQRVPGGTRDSLTPGPVPTVTPPEEVVAFFHTHPNTAGEGYSDGPSPADEAFHASIGLPGIVRGHDGTYTIDP